MEEVELRNFLCAAAGGLQEISQFRLFLLLLCRATKAARSIHQGKRRQQQDAG